MAFLCAEWRATESGSLRRPGGVPLTAAVPGRLWSAGRAASSPAECTQVLAFFPARCRGPRALRGRTAVSDQPRSLPDRPSLRYLKLEAKRRLAAGEFESLHLAQLAIAREHQQPSWTALKEAIEAQSDPAVPALTHVRWALSRFSLAGRPGWARAGRGRVARALRRALPDDALARENNADADRRGAAAGRRTRRRDRIGPRRPGPDLRHAAGGADRTRGAAPADPAAPVPAGPAAHRPAGRRDRDAYVRRAARLRDRGGRAGLRRAGAARAGRGRVGRHAGGRRRTRRRRHLDRGPRLGRTGRAPAPGGRAPRSRCTRSPC